MSLIYQTQFPEILVNFPSLLFFAERKWIGMLESEFQKKLIKRLRLEFPFCIVLKNDPQYLQGVPDLLILNADKWAMLEVKVDRKASKRPNQEYYIKRMDDMSFARFINPQNEEEILDELRTFFLE